MSLVRPKFMVLDSSTLGKVSQDYWSSDEARRKKAHFFISGLVNSNVFITLTMTHVVELLGIENESVANDRLTFLRSLPLVAWLRPYDCTFFPGTIIDLHRRELHAVLHADKSDYQSIIDNVRIDIWETGIGSDVFVNDIFGWDTIKYLSQKQQRRSQYVTSVLRTDPGKIKEITIGEIRKMTRRPSAEWPAFLHQFASVMKIQLEQHGDKRLETPEEAAKNFVIETHRSMQKIESGGGDLINQIIDYFGVPNELVSDEVTVGEVGQLAVYTKQLNLFAEGLNPPAAVTVQTVPLETLPSYVLEHKLAQIQRNAIRVSGSDFGDGNIAPLVFYADGVEVDKRTYEYLSQLRRSKRFSNGLMRCFFRSTDYSEILNKYVCDN